MLVLIHPDFLYIEPTHLIKGKLINRSESELSNNKEINTKIAYSRGFGVLAGHFSSATGSKNQANPLRIWHFCTREGQIVP